MGRPYRYSVLADPKLIKAMLNGAHRPRGFDHQNLTNEEFYSRIFERYAKRKPSETELEVFGKMVGSGQAEVVPQPDPLSIFRLEGLVENMLSWAINRRPAKGVGQHQFLKSIIEDMIHREPTKIELNHFKQLVRNRRMENEREASATSPPPSHELFRKNVFGTRTIDSVRVTITESAEPDPILPFLPSDKELLSETGQRLMGLQTVKLKKGARNNPQHGEAFQAMLGMSPEVNQIRKIIGLLSTPFLEMRHNWLETLGEQVDQEWNLLNEELTLTGLKYPARPYARPLTRDQALRAYGEEEIRVYTGHQSPQSFLEALKGSPGEAESSRWRTLPKSYMEGLYKLKEKGTLGEYKGRLGEAVPLPGDPTKSIFTDLIESRIVAKELIKMSPALDDSEYLSRRKEIYREQYQQARKASQDTIQRFMVPEGEEAIRSISALKLPAPICVFWFTSTDNDEFMLLATQAEDGPVMFPLGACMFDGQWRLLDPETLKSFPIFEFLQKHVIAGIITLDAEVTYIDRDEGPVLPRRRKASVLELTYSVVDLNRKRYGKRSEDQNEEEEEWTPKVRLHFRRGFWRRNQIDKTKRHWVRWCLVGTSTLGFVDKKYLL